MRTSKFRVFFRRIFKFLYHSKPIEKQEKPMETTLKIIKDSSDSETSKIETDSGSSQEPLIQKFPREALSSDSSSYLFDAESIKTEFYDDKKTLVKVRA